MAFDLEAHMEQHGHEALHTFYDNYTRANIIIAVHSTELGPALGGCRIKRYERQNHINAFEAAILDALNLSETMTYKAALAGLNLGGGKSVVYMNKVRTSATREQLLMRIGLCINYLKGIYITAEDMGTSVPDMDLLVKKGCKYVTGHSAEHGGGGDPSPMTAFGLHSAALVLAEKIFRQNSLDSMTVAVQGIGKVGTEWSRMLYDSNASIIVSDIRPEGIEHLFDAIKKRDGAVHEKRIKVVAPDEIYSTECDIFSPCAVGGTLNHKTIKNLKCRATLGSANNQLHDIIKDGMLLEKVGIIHIPDFSSNMGGLISVANEKGVTGLDYNAEDVRPVIQTNVTNAVRNIIEMREKEGITPYEAAIKEAKKRLSGIKKTPIIQSYAIEVYGKIRKKIRFL
jgi:leucine dehydrogenase